jgi:hypothetical protein
MQPDSYLTEFAGKLTLPRWPAYREAGNLGKYPARDKYLAPVVSRVGGGLF